MCNDHLGFSFIRRLCRSLLVCYFVTTFSFVSSEVWEDENSQPAKRLEVAALYGGIHDYAYYFADILVGTPPQRQSVIVDSGSSLLGFPCKKCNGCGKHIDKPFDFSASTTASWLSCKDALCISGCGTNNRCRYSQRYSEGSSISGHYFKDVVALGDLERHNAFVWFDHLGCHNEETNLFTTQKANGIMGISFPKARRQKTIIDSLFGADDVDTHVFALCLAEEGGGMTVGGYNESLHVLSKTKGSNAMARVAEQQRKLWAFSQSYNRNVKGEDSSNVAWTSVLSEDAYSVSLKKIEFNNEVIGTNFGSTIVDSGTTFTYFPPAVYRGIMKTLQDTCKESEACEIKVGSKLPCWKLNDISALSEIPSFFFHFGDDALVEWRANSFLYFQKDRRLWCPAIENNREKSTILGASFMKNQDVIFDRQHDLIGFAAAECPNKSAKERPPAPVPGKDVAEYIEHIPPLPPSHTSQTNEKSLFYFFDLRNFFSQNSSKRLAWIFSGLLISIVIGAMCMIIYRTLTRRSNPYRSMPAELIGGDDGDSEPEMAIQLTEIPLHTISTTERQPLTGFTADRDDIFSDDSFEQNDITAPQASLPGVRREYVTPQPWEKIGD